tara:strand:+ start:125 stop:532 length:408 start_codon:yes stop_codon:yes gene_type:complete
MSTASATVAQLMATPMTADLSFTGARIVADFRLLALCAKARRDPVLELLQRNACLTTAKAFLDLADTIGACWPENVTVARPCCPVVTPDEATIANMVDAARAGERERFSGQIDGFVRADRHDRLYARATVYASLI